MNGRTYHRPCIVLSAIAAALALAGCAGDVTEAPLSAYDLSDRNVVNAVMRELTPQQRGPFLTYTIHHLATSKAFCGDVLVDRNGREPATIGEAIRMTVAREAERNRQPEIVDPATLSPVVRYRMRLNELLDEREMLIDRREMLLMIGDGASRPERIAELETQIAASTEAIAALRTTAPPGADLP